MAKPSLEEVKDLIGKISINAKKHRSTVKRKLRVRFNLKKNNKSLLPKVVIFISNKHIYAQLVSLEGKVLASSSTKQLFKGKDSAKSYSDIASATKVGEDLAKNLKKIKINKFIIDKGAKPFHGKVKALADTLVENVK